MSAQLNWQIEKKGDAEITTAKPASSAYFMMKKIGGKNIH